MKTPPYQKAINAVALAMLTWWCASAEASDKPKVKTHDLSVPQSVFVDKQDSGRDPFFPHSVRRQETIARVLPTNDFPRVSAALSQLSLKGISGTKGQPLALINSSTIAEGELAEIRCGRQFVKVRCLEIRDRSVLVELYGTSQTRELKLREGI
jgi:hypothetical protein